jgi:prepilin-type N-terminal cleavage/methylation domain-containing protein
MTRTPTPRPRRGFTLIEVMISVLILALGLLGLGAVIPVIVAQQRRAAESTLGVSCLRGAMAKMDGRTHFIQGIEQPLWSQWLNNCQWSLPLEGGDWEVGDRRQCSSYAIAWSGPQQGTFEYRALVSQEFEITDAGDARWETTLQVQRRTVGPPPGSWQNYLSPERSSDLVRAVDRLYPSRESAGAGGRPSLVWDMAARRAGDRDLIVALFGRRVDSGIRIPPGGNLYDLVASGTVVPVGIAANGLPSLNGAGNYSRPITLDAILPQGAYLKTRVQFESGSAAQRQLASRPGQQFVDEFGGVYSVVSFDEQTSDLVLNRPVTWTPGETVRIVFVPEIAVNIVVRRITVPY